ncbi:MAG: Ku protein [Myxococcota bacterium]
MAARAIASGTIAFGLVSIPCKLFPSASPSDSIRFNNLHKECGSRVKNQHYCPKHDAVVTRDDLVKGYEFAKGQYVTFEEDELKAVAEQSSGGIDITEFVPIDQVDPIYYAKAYYLGPDGGAGRAYHLLAEALRRTGLVALAKYAARGKQYLVLLRPVKEGLIMQQLHYPKEIRPIADVDIEAADLKESELQLAMQLVQQGTAKVFRPSEYYDEVRDRIDALIAKKVDGEDIRTVAAEEPKTQVIDLMSALKASLGGDDDGARKGPQSEAAGDDVDKAEGEG